METKNAVNDEIVISKSASWRSLVLYPIALILLFEEWGWEPLAALFGRLARLPLWKRIERQILTLSPISVLFVFAIPITALLPVKLLALYLLGKGHALAGTTLFIGAKIFGTAICAKLFQLARPALMTIRWFARWYPRWKKWKDKIFGIVKRSALWLKMHEIKIKIKDWWHRIHPSRL